MILLNEYKLIATNSLGDSIDLWNDKEVALTSLEGVSPEVTVNTTKLAGSDGSYYNGSYCPDRSISLVVQYREEAIDAEKTKLRIYRAFRPKDKIHLRFISPNQDMYIEGYVAKCDTPPTTYPMVSQIVITCPDPYFKMNNVDPVHLFGIANMFYFLEEGVTLNNVCFGNTVRSRVAKIDYRGDMAVGVVIKVVLSTSCKNFRVDDLTTKQYMSISGDFISGDIITISTETGRKNITLTRNNEEIAGLKFMDLGSEFWQLIPGMNEIKFSSKGLDASAAQVLLYYDWKVDGI